jgi:uncharacterized protein (TIGR02996 family)
MSNEGAVMLEPILAHVRENPADLDCRLVLADWLEEHGDPERAELVRLQVERARRLAPLHDFEPDLDKRWILYSAREKHLIESNEQRWLGDLPAKPVDAFGLKKTTVSFARGLLQVRIPADVFSNFPVGLERCLREGWVERLEISGVNDDWVEAVTASPLLGFVPRLTIREGTNEVANRLADCDNLRQLTHLSLRSLGLVDRNLKALASSPSLSALQVLEMEEGDFSAEGMAALAMWPYLRRLRELLVGQYDLGVAEWSAFLDNLSLDSLRCLKLWDFDDPTAELLASSPKLARLTGLHAAHSTLTAAGVAALANSPFLESLTHLTLSKQRGRGDPAYEEVIRDVHLFEVARAQRWRNLRYLALQHSEVGEDGIRQLANSEQLASLRGLDLSLCDTLGTFGAQALADASGPVQLQYLNLRGSDIGDDGVQALASSPRLASLLHAEIFVSYVHDATLEAVANSPTLSSLLVLYVDEPEKAGWSDRAWSHLVFSPRLPALSYLCGPSLLAGDREDWRRYYAILDEIDGPPDPAKLPMLLRHLQVSSPQVREAVLAALESLARIHPLPLPVPAELARLAADPNPSGQPAVSAVWAWLAQGKQESLRWQEGRAVIELPLQAARDWPDPVKFRALADIPRWLDQPCPYWDTDQPTIEDFQADILTVVLDGVRAWPVSVKVRALGEIEAWFRAQAKERLEVVMRPLLSWLHDEAPAIRAAVASIIADYEHIEAHLVPLLRDSDDGTREHISALLYEKCRRPECPPETIPFWVDALSDSSVDNRRRAAIVLGRTRTITVLHAVEADLGRLVADANAEVRWAAVDALSRLKQLTPTTVLALEAGLADTDEAVRQTCAVALVGADVATPRLVQTLQGWFRQHTLSDSPHLLKLPDRLAEATTPCWPALFEVLAEGLHNPDAQVRAHSVAHLAEKFGNSPELVPLATGLLRDNEERVCQTAARALGYAQLTRQLGPTGAAATALREIAQQSPPDPLESLFPPPDPETFLGALDESVTRQEIIGQWLREGKSVEVIRRLHQAIR